MFKVTLKHTPRLRDWQHLVHGPVVQGVHQQPSTTLQNSTPIRARQNYESISHHGIFAKTSSRYNAFQRLLWKPNEDASQESSWNQMSLTIYQGHQTHSKQFFQYVVHRVNGGCIVRDLETLIVLVLLAFNFIPQRSH